MLAGREEAGGPPKPNKHLTLNGYLKRDAYQSLDASMIAQDYPQVCYAAVELVCTGGEGRTLVNHVVDAYCRNFISSNGWLLDAVLTLTHDILAACGKKGSVLDSVYRKQTCRLLMLITQEGKKDTSVLARLMNESAEKFYRDVTEHTELSKRYFTLLASGVIKQLSAVLQHTQGGNVHAALAVAGHLLAAKHDVQPAPFDFVHELKDAQRKDVVWYLWDVLLEASRRTGELMQRFVRSASMLYMLNYSKKARMTRINFLLYAILVLGRRKVKSRERDATKLVCSACQKIDVVFCETLKLPLPREYLQYYTQRKFS